MPEEGIPEGYKKVRKSLYSDNPNLPLEYDLAPRTEGWQYPFGSPESLALWNRKQREQVRAKIELEKQKAPEDRFRPPEKYNPLSLDILSTGGYITGSLLKGTQQKRLGQDVDTYKSFREKTLVSDILMPPLGQETAESIAWQINLRTAIPGTPLAQMRNLPDWGQRLTLDIVTDPFAYLTGVSTGVKVFVNGKKVALTNEGATFLKSMFQNVPVKELEKTRYLFSNLLKTNPEMYVRFVQKEGMRIVWTNLEVIPKQFLPWRWVVPVGKKFVDVGRGGWDIVASAFARQYGKLLSKIPKTAPLPPPPTFNQMRAANLLDLKNAKKAAEQQVALLLDEAKKQTGRYFNPKVIMTEYAENPNIRNMFPELKPIFDKWETIRQQMVAIEKSEGLLHSERFDYVRHFITWTAKKAKGIKGEKVDAPFDIARKVEGTISQINTQSLKDKGYKLFNDNFFFAMLKRMEEHEQAVAGVKLIRSAGQQFGKTAKEVAGDKNYIPSSFPQLKGIYLPKTVERALKEDKNIKQVTELMGVKTRYEAAKDVITLPLKKGYEFQAWTVHTWEKLQTRYFPAFYAVNFYGGKFMAWLGGSANIADDAAALKAMSGRTDKTKVIVIDELTGKEYTKEMINKLADEYKLTHVGMLGVEAGKQEVRGITGRIVKAGWMMEEELRLTMFINRLRKGDKPAEAYNYVIKYQFDYVSEFQGAEKVLSDWIPFFRWQKNAIPFFAQMTFEAYGKMGIFGKLAAATWTSPEAEVTKPYMPIWTQTRPNFYLGGERNDVASFNLPMMQWAETMRKLDSPSNATQALGPFPQITNKLYTGFDPYTGQNITASDAVLNTMLGRWIQTTKKVFNPDIPFWEKAVELGTGTQIIQLTDQMRYSGILDQTSDRIVTNAMHRLTGRYRACGV